MYTGSAKFSQLNSILDCWAHEIPREARKLAMNIRSYQSTMEITQVEGEDVSMYVSTSTYVDIISTCDDVNLHLTINNWAFLPTTTSKSSEIQEIGQFCLKLCLLWNHDQCTATAKASSMNAMLFTLGL